MKKLLTILTVSIGLAFPAVADQDINNTILELKERGVTQFAVNSRTQPKPILITGIESAKKYFKGDALKTILNLDFKKKKVLLFVWGGSGGDRLSFSLTEDKPAQVNFKLKYGRTRDFFIHRKTFILDKNAKFKSPFKPPRPPQKIGRPGFRPKKEVKEKNTKDSLC